MKLVVEQDMQKPGGYVGKMYYFDEINNVARLLIDDIGLYSVQAQEEEAGFGNFASNDNTKIKSPKFEDFIFMIPEYSAHEEE